MDIRRKKEDEGERGSTGSDRNQAAKKKQSKFLDREEPHL